MQSNPTWLYDRWYGSAARERLRQLALWSADPIYVYVNCGLPFDSEKLAENELQVFQQEGVVKLWQYEKERLYPNSISPFLATPPLVISNPSYERMIHYVDSRLENSVPDAHDLGFENIEGMLLEQVVLRRRFFSQAICGALNVNTVADATTHLDLYKIKSNTGDQISDTLEQFFSAVNVPSLVLLDVEGFMRLREKSQVILSEIVSEIYEQLNQPHGQLEKVQLDIVNSLVRQYENEILSRVKQQRGKSAKLAMEAFEQGTQTQIQSQLAGFSLDSSTSDMSSWFSQNSEGMCQITLLLLEWKSGKFNPTNLRDE